MLRLSVHAGPLAELSRFNRTDWLDLGYERLDAHADYKAVLFNIDAGATPPYYLRNYPRWSASLWDLVARALALGLSADPERAVESVPAIELGGRRAAFASAVSAVIEHFPSWGRGGRRLAAMEIVHHRRARGVYRATVDEDLQASLSTLPFLFAPRVLRPAELVLRATLVRLTGQHAALPPRPALRLPVIQTVEGLPYIAVSRLAEPARTGFLRWLRRFSEEPREADEAPDGLAPEPLFVQFLREAV